MDEAEEDINKSIILDSDNPWAYRNKGIFYQMKGDHESAIRLLSQALEMDENVDRVHFYLGISHEQRQEKDKACQHFQSALDAGDKEAAERYRKECL